MLKNLKIVNLLFLFGIKDVSESIVKILADLVMTGMRFGIAIWLYYYLFLAKGGEIMGQSLQVIIWSMFFYFVFYYVNPRYLTKEIQADIQSGKIEVLLSKPISYLYYKLGEYLGNRFTTFIFTSIFGFTIMFLFLDLPIYILSNLNFYIFTFIITFLLCFILSFQIWSILGLLCFWFQDINPIRWIIDKMTMILGGAYFPVVFFPSILKNISLYSPIGASQFITYVAYENWQFTYLKMFIVQIFWIIVLGIILNVMQKSAFKKLSVNGG